jgi:hypothetical protein
LIRRRIEQRGDLGFGQLLSSHHSCLPGVVGRPADPGQGVDQGAALEAEGPADHRFAGARCIWSERTAGGTMTTSARLGTRPMPLEFVVWPLMCEIEVFR